MGAVNLLGTGGLGQGFIFEGADLAQVGELGEGVNRQVAVLIDFRIERQDAVGDGLLDFSVPLADDGLVHGHGHGGEVLRQAVDFSFAQLVGLFVILVEVQGFGPDGAQGAHVQVIVQGNHGAGPDALAHIAHAQVEDVRGIAGGQGSFQFGPVLVTGDAEVHDAVVLFLELFDHFFIHCLFMFLGKGVHNDGGLVVRHRDGREQRGKQAHGQQQSQQFLHKGVPPLSADIIIRLLFTLTLMLQAVFCPDHTCSS